MEALAEEVADLAHAALIAADIDDLEQVLPDTLRAATAALRGSRMLRDALVEHFAHAADWEQRQYHRTVTDWDVGRGFERA